MFDTTDEEEARKVGAYNEKHTYGPVLVVVGGRMVPKGVESKLEEMSVGEEKEFTIKADEGFGPRDPKLVKIRR
jgi:FKBP-type peptidyl-prolyl cis-trans isomerase 2